jgi:hypothetical protein
LTSLAEGGESNLCPDHPRDPGTCAAAFEKPARSCLDADPINPHALESAAKLKRQCQFIDKFFPDYIEALIEMNKRGGIWARFRYRDHHPLTYKVFRWTPLKQAVNEYDRALRDAR